MYDHNLGMNLSSGITVRVIAKEEDRVGYHDGTKSKLEFHPNLDGAGVVPLPGGGYFYVSNSEKNDGGGVYGVYCDAAGRVAEYKPLLTKTSLNCNGGLTPWNTWVSCEEQDLDSAGRYVLSRCWRRRWHFVLLRAEIFASLLGRPKPRWRKSQ